jgi:hypothetical protein
VWRDGKLVRMDVGAALPDRCVVCNRPAARRVARSLYCSPPAWRFGAFVVPLAMVWVGAVTGERWLTMLFWPIVIVLVIVHFFVRVKFRVELGVCDRHWRIRFLLQALSIAAIAAVLLLVFNFRIDTSGVLLAMAAGAVIVLAIAQSYSGLQAVAAQRLTPEHAWLARTGKPFREALPELPGA